MGKIKDIAENYNAPTPKKSKFWRNVFALIASIGVALAPFTGGASGIVSIVALVANIIAGSKVLNEEDVAKMSKQELKSVRSALIEKKKQKMNRPDLPISYELDLSESEMSALDIIDNELKSRV